MIFRLIAFHRVNECAQSIATHRQLGDNDGASGTFRRPNKPPFALELDELGLTGADRIAPS